MGLATWVPGRTEPTAGWAVGLQCREARVGLQGEHQEVALHHLGADGFVGREESRLERLGIHGDLVVGVGTTGKHLDEEKAGTGLLGGVAEG